MILGTGNPEVLEIVHEQLGMGMAVLPTMRTALNWQMKFTGPYSLANRSALLARVVKLICMPYG